MISVVRIGCLKGKGSVRGTKASMHACSKIAALPILVSLAGYVRIFHGGLCIDHMYGHGALFTEISLAVSSGMCVDVNVRRVLHIGKRNGGSQR